MGTELNKLWTVPCPLGSTERMCLLIKELCVKVLAVPITSLWHLARQYGLPPSRHLSPLVILEGVRTRLQTQTGHLVHMSDRV